MQKETTTYFIEGLCCAAEESLIRKKLSALPGVDEMKFILISRKLTVRHSCPKDDIARALREIGFTPKLQFELAAPKSFYDRHRRLIFTITASVFFLAGIIVNSINSLQNISAYLFVIAALLSGWKIGIKGLKAARHFSLDMNFLMTIASIGAMALGKWTEGAAILILFSLSEAMESYSMDRTRRAIRELIDISPTLATVRRDGKEYSVLVEEIAVGERIIIRPGERIALDGVAVAGESTVNQSPITGESIPVMKRKGDTVFAGTLNQAGYLEIEVTKRSHDTTLARIVQTVEEAQSGRAPIQTFVERFSRYYSPSIFFLALALAIAPPVFFGGSFMVWIYRSLILLVIACPCALVISTPITIVSGLTNAARNGVLIKGGRHLEILAEVQAIAFDKTGTLTEGIPRVTDVIPVNSLSEHQILTLLASIELKSEHHVAAAILRKAQEEGITLDQIPFDQFESLAGRGVKAVSNGETYFAGNHEFVEEHRICTPEVERILQSLEADGKTTTILCNLREPLGIIAIQDAVRKESGTIVEHLHSAGVKKIVLLTGDNPAAARAIGSHAGIDEVHAGVMPGEKVAEIHRLKEQYGNVAMVGDGVNDAPALAASSLGIAMGKNGADVALETADIVLMSDDLTKLPETVMLGKKALRVIKENIIFAVAVKAIFLLLGVFGMTSLWLAVLADDGAALVVIMNSLRLLWHNGSKVERNLFRS
ncbi:MAG: heavy metal translocating P-type ATPase [Bacteroidota bacterium]